MKQLSSAQVRQMWLDFWASKGHSVEPSVSLVPVNDPTLLWINSGVATLKKYFDGTIKPENPRITNAQKAIRTNDIEDLGLRVQGNIWDLEFKLFDDRDQIVAEISKELFHLTSTYQVSVYEDEYADLVISLCVAIDYVEMLEAGTN